VLALLKKATANEKKNQLYFIADTVRHRLLPRSKERLLQLETDNKTHQKTSLTKHTYRFEVRKGSLKTKLKTLGRCVESDSDAAARMRAKQGKIDGPKAILGISKLRPI
jgi:hypothetical protein